MCCWCGLFAGKEETKHELIPVTDRMGIFPMEIPAGKPENEFQECQTAVSYSLTLLLNDTARALFYNFVFSQRQVGVLGLAIACVLIVFCILVHHQLCKSLAVELSAKHGVGKSMLILLQNPNDPVLKPSVYTMFCNSCLELHCNWNNPPGSDDCLVFYSHTFFF